jgi:hypothetical protein
VTVNVERREEAMRRIPKRTLVWVLLYIAVAGTLVTTLVLIGLGYLTLPTASPSTVTVSEVEWTLVQGNTSSGRGWFGPSAFTYGENAGFPRTETVGRSFGLPWAPENFDTSSHTVYTVSIANPGYCIDSARPALPQVVPPGDDGGEFEFQVSIPSGASGSVALQVTVDAENPAQQSYCS